MQPEDFLAFQDTEFFYTTVAVRLYKSLIIAKLQYCSLLYTRITKVDRQRIYKMQIRALWVCLLVDQYTSNLTLHRESKVLPMKLRSKLEMYKLMFRISRKEQSTMDSPTYPTRLQSSYPSGYWHIKIREISMFGFLLGTEIMD